jgi:hypothetical protein
MSLSVYAKANGTQGALQVNGVDALILDTGGTVSGVRKSSVTEMPTLETAKPTTSGTTVEFTGIPSWIKQITLMISGVSTSGTSIVHVQLGSTTFQTTGYSTWTGTSGTNTGPNTTGFYTGVSSDATFSRHGSIIFNHMGNNIWVGSGTIGASTYPAAISGSVTLSGVLDRIRLTTVNGTDTFDAGSINILYE